MNGVEGSTLNFIIMDWRGITPEGSKMEGDCCIWRVSYAISSLPEPERNYQEEV